MDKTRALDIDVYGHRHLAEHLFRAGLQDELYRLVTSPIWHQTTGQFDPNGRQYIADIRWAFRAIEASLVAGTESVRSTLLGKSSARLAALGWLSASLGQAAAQIPIPVLEAIGRLGDVEQALQRSESISAPMRRAQALTCIGSVAFDAQQHIRAHSIWAEAWDILRRTPTDIFNDRYEAWAQLAQAIAQTGQIEWARSVLTELTIEVELTRPDAITMSTYITLSEAWGIVGDREQALAIAQKPDDLDSRASALCAAAYGLAKSSGTIDGELLKAAIESIPQIHNQAVWSQLAELLARAGRLAEARQFVTAENKTERHIRILWAAAQEALDRGEIKEGEQLLKEGIAELQILGTARQRLQYLAQLSRWRLLGPTSEVSNELLVKLRGEWQEHMDEVDPDLLGEVALGLIALGDLATAQKAVWRALRLEHSQDNWEEADGLALLAQICADAGDEDGIKWTLQRAHQRTDSWQQAEIAYNVARAARHIGNRELYVQAEQLLVAAANKETGTHWRPNVRGVLAAWQAMMAGLPESAQILIDTTVTELSREGELDNLALLARTLAAAGCPAAADVLRYILNVISNESDLNTQARVIGTAAEAAALIPDRMILDAFRTKAKAIQVDWLRAEALFWISGWQSTLKVYAESRQTYLDAVSSGLWEPTAPSSIAAAWTAGHSEWVHDVASRAGWPSTTAAAAFAGLALMCEKLPRGWFEASLVALEDIPVEHSQTRGKCHRLIIQSAAQLPNEPMTVLRYWISALNLSLSRDVGEIWSCIGACAPILFSQVGSSFIKALWTELVNIYGLLWPVYHTSD